jgi:hypothetical protein
MFRWKVVPGPPELGDIVSGVFTPVLAKHTKSFNLVDTLSVGVDRIQRNFEPLQRQVELWRKTQITDDTAKLIFYSAFIDGKLEAPRTLLPEVHRLYFEPQYPEFAAKTMWSLSNAFTSAFKMLDPVPQFKATASGRLSRTTAQLIRDLRCPYHARRSRFIFTALNYHGSTAPSRKESPCSRN